MDLVFEYKGICHSSETKGRHIYTDTFGHFCAWHWNCLQIPQRAVLLCDCHDSEADLKNCSKCSFCSNNRTNSSCGRSCYRGSFDFLQRTYNSSWVYLLSPIFLFSQILCFGLPEYGYSVLIWVSVHFLFLIPFLVFSCNRNYCCVGQLRI